MRASLSRLNAFALFALLGFSSNARANLYGTTWNLTGNFTVGSGDYIQMTGGDSFLYENGYFSHNDSTMDFSGNAQIGLNNWAVFYQNGGQMNVGGFLSIARYGGSGYLEVNGGTVNSYNHQIIVGEVGYGSMTMNGGYAYTYQGVTLGQNGGSTGNLSLNGGTLEAGAIWKGGGTGNLGFNGGTLKATHDEWNYISGLNSANIGGSGAVIDNNGKAPGINQTLTGSGSGSVKFDGSGWTTLRQNNTFTGDTLVRGGTLQIYENGSLYNNGTAAGNIYVNSGASLYFNRDNVFGNADTGSSSPVSITLNGGTINNGNGGVSGGGVFNNIANLTMNGGNLNASGGAGDGWNAYELNSVTVGGSSASTITSNTSINGNNAILLSRAGMTTFNVGATGDATGDLKVSAKLTDGNGVVGSLTKTGAGKMVLSAVNTYTGETKVFAGTLAVDTGGSIVSSSTQISSGATLQGAGSIAALTVESGGVVKITNASTTSTAAWNTGGTINFNTGSKIDVTGLNLSQQPYVLIRGTSVSGTPIVQGATGFTVSNTDNTITLTPIPTYTYTIANNQATITKYNGTDGVVEIPSAIGGVAVTTIGQNAFQGQSNVTAVVIPIGVTTIMDGAFAGCSGMTAITLPNSLTSIGNYAFDGCSSLGSITLPDGVTSIGANAFAWCTSLPSITLPSGLKKILSGTFWTCNNLTSITIPGGVDEIQYNAFLNCSKLASVYFLGNTPPTIGANAFLGIAIGAVGYYPATASAAWQGVTIAGLTLTPFGQVSHAPVILSRFAVGFNEDGTSTAGWTGVGANDTYGPDKPSFSNGVLVATATGSSSLGSTPLMAGTYTVQFAHGLPFANGAPGTLTVSAEAVANGSSTTLSSLGTSPALTLRTDTTWTTDSFTFTIPNGDPAIGRYLKLTFNHSAQNVWHGIDSVSVFISGSSTFGIPALTEDATGNLQFSGTPFSDVDSSSLTVTLSVDAGTITGNAGTGITVGGTATGRTFAGTLADLNAYFITAGKITYLAPQDFNGSKTIGILVSDGQLTATGSATINVQPSNDAPVLAEILSSYSGGFNQPQTIPLVASDVETPVGDLVFTASSNNQILFPIGNLEVRGVLSSGNGIGGGSLGSTTYGGGVSQIGNSLGGGSEMSWELVATPAAGQSGEADITITVTDGGGALASRTFHITVLDAYTTWANQYFGQTGGNTVPTADPDGDGATNQQEFAAGTNPNDANSQPEVFAYRFTFRGPAGRWNYQGAVLSNPGDQATVTGRIYGLIEGTSAAKRIVLETVNGDVNLGMIYGGTNPVVIVPVHAARNSFTVTNGQLTGVDFAYTYNSSGTFESDFSHTDYVPGNQALNLSLSAGSLSFGSMNAYGQIDVGSSGSPVFQKVAREVDFTINPNTGTITGYNGQGGDVVIPSTIGGVAVTKIGDNAFQGMVNLTEVVIPESVTSIGSNAFFFCSILSSITIPDSVLLIGENAFWNCHKLKSATIGNGVTALPRNAFSECHDLTSVSLGANVKTLGDYAFNNCAKLKSITFPSGFESMGAYAFALCADLTSITFPESVHTIGNRAFQQCTKLTTVNFQGNTPPTVGGEAFSGIATGAMGYYPATASANWSGVSYSGITIRSNDQIAPVITLIGANPIEIYEGGSFSDPGAAVTDNVDTTRTITGSGTVNTATVGNYTLTYNTTDAAGNLAASVTRTVVVKSIPATITLSAESGSYTLLQGAVPLDDSLTVSGGGTFSGATIQIETGFAAGDTLNLTPSIGGITGIYDGTKGILTLSGSGSASVYQSALRAVTFSTTSTSTVARGFKVTLGSAISFGGHYYEYVPGSHSWAGARTLALSKTFNGLSGYLANLTSADENSFVKTKIGMDVWIGGSDEGTEGVWKWMDGPEAGITFWNGLFGGSAPSGRYANWNSGEPNDAGNEDYAQFFVNTGKWNDLPSGSRLGFLVEYGTDTSAIQTFSGTRIFSVTKATPTIIAAPTAAPISYGQTLGSSTLSGGSGSVAGTFAWITPSTSPNAGTFIQGLTFTPSDTANYNTATTSVSVTVNKATPAITAAPTATSIGYGQTLGSSILNGGVGSVPGSFAWTTPATLPNSGTASQGVTFTPSDTANYNTVTRSVSVTVSKAMPSITTAPAAKAIGYGQTLAFSTLSGGEVRAGETLVLGTFAFSNPAVAPSTGTSSQTVIFTPSDTANYITVTIPVNVTVNPALISSGFSHTLYLSAGASNVTAWGLNTDGRLGVGNTNSSLNWAQAVQGIPSGATIAGLSAGGTHSLILAGGQVYAAGSDRFGQLGQGAVNGANKAGFTPVPMTSNIPVAVAAGGNHSLIVTASGKVFAFGDNTYGQLARSSNIASLGTLSQVDGLTNRIVSVAAGADHNLALDENGGVWVWGRNDSGQLGKNTRTSAERIPVRIISSGAKAVAAGYAHSLVLMQNGTVQGFGKNTLGQTGQSSATTYAKAPVTIPGMSGIRSISAGTDSSFAITESGQLYGWGYNSYGELLLGYASPISAPAVYGPTPSPICTNISNVSGGGYSSLAVGAQGVVFAGRNDMGQSGNGPDPEQVVGDYFYETENLVMANLTMDLAGTTETLYDQVFVGNGAATLNGILNLMFVGTYTGPVYGSTQTFDLIWAKSGIVLGTGYQLAFNQSGYLVESVVANKEVNGVSGQVLQATVRAVVTAADLVKAGDLAKPSLDGVESVSYGASTGIRALSLPTGVEMIYSYERPTGGVSSGPQYFVNGITYRVEQVSSLTNAWGDASVSGTTVTPLGNGRERVTLRVSSSGGAGFLRLTIETPQATGISAGVSNAVTY